MSTPFAARDAHRVGERLAAARHERGFELEDVAERTRIPKRHIALIEAGIAEGLPALTYSAGFVRNYARLVGLDGDELARQFRAEMGQPVRSDLPEPYEPADPARIPSKLLAVVALLLAVAVAGGYAIWRGDGLLGGGAIQRERLAAGTEPVAPTSGSPPAATLAPAPAPPPSPARAEPLIPRATGPVVVAAVDDAWVKISERDGRTMFMGIMKPGQKFEVPADAADPVIRTSRAPSLAITVGGVAIPALAPPDTLVREASLEREALLARTAPGAAPPAGTIPAQARP